MSAGRRANWGSAPSPVRRIPDVSSPSEWLVLLGLGANLGDPTKQLVHAVERLGELVAVDAVSAVYRTEPVGYRPQPDFYNMVLRARTALAPIQLLGRTQEVERDLGRVRTFSNAPRTLDVDLLAYSDWILNTPDLTVPHPRMHQRAFVLVPLVEVAPEWRHPLLNRTARELLLSAPVLERVDWWGPPPALP